MLTRGNDLVVSAWDIISGDVKPGANVLLFDDAGDHAALQAAEFIAAAGAQGGGHDARPRLRAGSDGDEPRSLYALPANVDVDLHRDLSAVGRCARDGNRLRATIGSDYGGVQQDRVVDQVVVNHGTIPMDDLYFELKPLSRNLGAVDYAALIERRSASGGTQSGRQVRALSDRRRRLRAQHPCRDLRRRAIGEGHLMSRLTPTQFAPRQERDEEKCEALSAHFMLQTFNSSPHPAFRPSRPEITVIQRGETAP